MGSVFPKYPFRFDSQKSLEVLLYIVTKLKKPGIYNTLKMLYFADLLHLEDYGRFICGDSYVAMKNGPVPSNSYDILKYVRGDGSNNFEFIGAEKALSIEGNEISAKRSPDCLIFSESEIECLDSTIKKYGHLTFGDLRKKSHDKNFESANKNDFIEIEEIIKNTPKGKKLLDHLKNPHPG
ncbi:MAG TPA: Panacea domain-containing protein [Flavobacteriaceae bacterium]|jgi:uncharacterized phage-associated protein